MKSLTVYLIHFDKPVGRARHYTGITRWDRLANRLREHGHGRGARLTARAVKQGVTMFLASTVSVDDPSEERTIKRRGHAKDRCPICRNGLGGTEPLGRFHQLPKLPKLTYKPLEF